MVPPRHEYISEDVLVDAVMEITNELNEVDQVQMNVAAAVFIKDIKVAIQRSLDPLEQVQVVKMEIGDHIPSQVAIGEVGEPVVHGAEPVATELAAPAPNDLGNWSDLGRLV